MPLSRFIETLFSDGRVRVGAAVDRSGELLNLDPDELRTANFLLASLESQYRLELPGTPPEPTLPAMIWGATTVYRAASFLAHRDANEDAIRRALSVPCPIEPSPSTCYSVDLTLRFLPDLVRLAKAVSSNDPLVGILMTLARQWPLSSVGVTDVGPVEVHPFIDDDCLRRLYVDRIIASKDCSRLGDARVSDAVKTAVGIHRELFPELTVQPALQE